MLTNMTNTHKNKIKILRWDYPGGPQCSHIYACERGAEGDWTQRRGEGTVSTEAETGVMWSQANFHPVKLVLDCWPPEL